eukprot:3629779-Amphidinium_carterae.2
MDAHRTVVFRSTIYPPPLIINCFKHKDAHFTLVHNPHLPDDSHNCPQSTCHINHVHFPLKRALLKDIREGMNPMSTYSTYAIQQAYNERFDLCLAWAVVIPDFMDTLTTTSHHMTLFINNTRYTIPMQTWMSFTQTIVHARTFAPFHITTIHDIIEHAIFKVRHTVKNLLRQVMQRMNPQARVWQNARTTVFNHVATSTNDIAELLHTVLFDTTYGSQHTIPKYMRCLACTNEPFRPQFIPRSAQPASSHLVAIIIEDDKIQHMPTLLNKVFEENFQNARTAPQSPVQQTIPAMIPTRVISPTLLYEPAFLEGGAQSTADDSIIEREIEVNAWTCTTDTQPEVIILTKTKAATIGDVQQNMLKNLN